jgi:hypothetical protein
MCCSTSSFTIWSKQGRLGCSPIECIDGNGYFRSLVSLLLRIRHAQAALKEGES